MPRAAPLRALPGNARQVTFLPRRQQQAQQRMRAEQATGDWRRRYALRCGVERLIPQASRLAQPPPAT